MIDGASRGVCFKKLKSVGIGIANVYGLSVRSLARGLDVADARTARVGYRALKWQYVNVVEDVF